MTVFKALNELEVALEKAQRGQMPVKNFLHMLAGSDLAVPSAAEVTEDGGGFEPLLFQKGSVQMLACFTDKSRIGEYTSLVPYCLMIKARDLLRRTPPGYGLVIDPGSIVGFDISPEGIEKVVSEMIST